MVLLQADDRVLQALKYIIDVQPIRPTTHDELTSLLQRYVGADIFAWHVAVIYANQRSHALDEELGQLRSRLAEIAAIRTGEVAVADPSYAADLDATPEAIRDARGWELRDFVVDLILERRRKEEDVGRIRYEVVREGHCR